MPTPIPSPRSESATHAVRVQYTAREDFAETNQKNIRAVMAELAALGDVGIQYSAFRTGDGNTFVHLVAMDAESKSGIVPSLAAFGHFRAQLKEGAVGPPNNETWQVVGISYTA